jgi:hypothetical protein
MPENTTISSQIQTRASTGKPEDLTGPKLSSNRHNSPNYCSRCAKNAARREPAEVQIGTSAVEPLSDRARGVRGQVTPWLCSAFCSLGATNNQRSGGCANGLLDCRVLPAFASDCRPWHEDGAIPDFACGDAHVGGIAP